MAYSTLPVRKIRSWPIGSMPFRGPTTMDKKTDHERKCILKLVLDRKKCIKSKNENFTLKILENTALI